MTEEAKKDLKEMGLDRADITERLPQEMKDQIESSLKSLWTLYEEDVNVDNATIEAALYYLPLLNIHGLILASFLGVNMDEYYLITEHLATQLGLIREE